MKQELVFFRWDLEADWIGPIVDIQITPDKIVVNNGYNTYTYLKDKEKNLWHEDGKRSHYFDSYVIREMNGE